MRFIGLRPLDVKVLAGRGFPDGGPNGGGVCRVDKNGAEIS